MRATARLQSLARSLTQAPRATRMASSSASDTPAFERSPVPSGNPLGEGRHVTSAACLIIGDEVLNGKTHDSNSNFLAKQLFDLGISLKEIQVIPDEEERIIEAAKRMTASYDLVVTSGGIGPTHDDITYDSMAKAFGVELKYHDETIHRMYEMGKKRYAEQKQTEEQMQARKRMALLPNPAEVLFVQPDLWVPIVRLGGKLCILPGVPRLFQQLTIGLLRYLPLPPSDMKPYRHLIHTKQPESSIAPFLTSLQNRVKEEGISVGSYPKLLAGVDVSLIGKDLARLQELGQEVVKELDGKVVAEGRVGEEKDLK
ncbi:uncharacterized protein L969DRAFT_93417 [Mixia osmundae IAM 14324]|uniref:MoaB/Mog domain-containing protein n=1 Tax=Mixia osmundae (strain CBS 9802 / IAM 14324 / JCM 22182 / KY 12970) TaxID=764103 RepID=G7EAR6_MIXOS|nr:uncharacterized protein L969DRAFT_93417 [Mixia osmundae IAM 14324]KEI40895.1 hypothetical protein L969DRAFT_93417 [Mixia osmundae IAM 14324]GAA99926.1 hypothetical protein E5Q_06629 [Mixia osmundae IAM 14324]